VKGDLAKVVLIPNAILVPLIAVLCAIGSYSIRGYMIDIVIMVILGVIGYCLVKAKWPLPCFVLGFVLGNILESNFHRTLLIGHGSIKPFFTRPGSLGILILTLVLLIWPYLSPYVKKLRKGKTDAEAEALRSTLGDDD
jgi:putative tricarboxylic transport membrane protein